MNGLLGFLKNTPKIRGWLTVALMSLSYFEEVIDKINADDNLPNIGKGKK